MKRKLWTVLADCEPVAVVAAERSDDAWRIVAALAEHDDLPRDVVHTDIAPCPRGQARRTVDLARSLGCADTFLACVRDGLFLTAISGLAAPPPELWRQ